METLKEGQYLLPEGLTINRTIKDGILIVRKSKKKIIKDYRCRDCVHCIKGPTVKASYWTSDICEKKPKGYKNFKGDDCYKAVRLLDKICDKFELKENN